MACPEGSQDRLPREIGSSLSRLISVLVGTAASLGLLAGWRSRPLASRADLASQSAFDSGGVPRRSASPCAVRSRDRCRRRLARDRCLARHLFRTLCPGDLTVAARPSGAGPNLQRSFTVDGSAGEGYATFCPRR